MTGNRIELRGRVLNPPEFRTTPAGTPVLRFVVECGASGEDLKLGIVVTGEAATAAKGLLEPGRQVRVTGRLRALKMSRAEIEVVAASIDEVGRD